MNGYHESARAGLPVYSLGGGKGYVWIARFGKNGVKGVLRFLAAVYCGTDLRQPTALIQAAKDSSPTFALATRS